MQVPQALISDVDAGVPNLYSHFVHNRTVEPIQKLGHEIPLMVFAMLPEGIRKLDAETDCFFGFELVNVKVEGKRRGHPPPTFVFPIVEVKGKGTRLSDPLGANVSEPSFL